MSYQPTAFRRQCRLASHRADFRLTGKSYGRGQLQTVVYDVVGGYEAFSVIGYTRDSVGEVRGTCSVYVYRTADDTLVASGVSDLGGYFRFDNLGAGPFYVVAFDASGAPVLAGTSSNEVFATPAPIPAIGSYTTAFPGTENPISETNLWLNGGTNGIDFQNVRTTPGKAFGVGASAGYDDCTACLKTSIGISSTKHYSRPTLYRALGYTPPGTPEVAVITGCTIAANSIKLYECIFPFGSTMQLVRWNGAVGDFTVNGSAGWTDTPTGPGYTDAQLNDVLEVRYDATSGNVLLTVFVNGAQVLQLADTSASRLLSGQPGISFFARAGAGLDMASYCFKAFQAGSL